MTTANEQCPFCPFITSVPATLRGHISREHPKELAASESMYSLLDAKPIAVALAPKDWTLIAFLVRQGMVNELNSYVVNNHHKPESMTDFIEVTKRLYASLPILVAHPLKPVGDLPRPETDAYGRARQEEPEPEPDAYGKPRASSAGE